MFLHHDNIQGRLQPGETPGTHRYDEKDLAALRGTLDGPGLLTLSRTGERVYAAGAELQPGLFLFSVLPSVEIQQATARLRNVVALVTIGTIIGFTLLLFSILRWLVVNPLGVLDRPARPQCRGFPPNPGGIFSPRPAPCSSFRPSIPFW